MRAQREALLLEIYEKLFAAFGPQHWWPAQTPFEVILGALLAQNTAWKNAAAAIANLEKNGLLHFEALCSLDGPHLEALIRPSGFYRQKATRIMAFCDHLQKKHHGCLEQFLAQDMEPLRRELLTIRGIGPETADSIVLYAAFRPSFVVDAYTWRIFSRHAWIEENISYDDLREYFMEALEPDVATFQEFHALLVRTGHLYCRKKPLCPMCPLGVYLNAW
ncbi:MAG: endonuclease III domain-containing protein [Syntrophobacteraceae bacterium]